MDAVEIALGRVLGRGDEVDPARLVVDRDELDHVEIARRDQHVGSSPLAADAVDMPPAVALAEPEELLAVVKPSAARPGDRPRRRVVGLGQGIGATTVGRVRGMSASMTRTVFWCRFNCWRTSSSELPAHSM